MGIEPFLWGPMHTSWEILGAGQGDLRGKCVALGVTGGVSVYRSVDLARTLMRMGATVRVVMTGEATRFLSPMVFEWATGLPAVAGKLTGMTEHVALAEHCDALLVAPATMDTLSEIAFYRASTPVSALAQEALGRGKPVLVVPAMHQGMWERSKRLVEELERQGVHVLKPLLEEGKAKYPPVEAVAWWAEAVITRGRDYDGRTVVVTAGATWEYIDPVRIITNPSTGLMGYSIAYEAAWRGARVVLVHGHVCSVPDWPYAEKIGVDTAQDMAEALPRIVGGEKPYAAFYAAAVSDYRPARRAEKKIPTSTGRLVLELEPTPKAIEAAVKASPSTIHVGFAAETVETVEELYRKAVEKLEKYGLDYVAANNVAAPGVGFGSWENEVLVVSKRREKWLIERMAKRLVARRLLDIVSPRRRSGE